MIRGGSRVRLPRPQNRDTCMYAEGFSAWVRDLFDRVDLKDLMQIHQATLQLTMQYHQWYAQAPQAHQVRVGPKGHLCIFHVFIHALNDLMEARTSLDPPTYFPPPPPPPPPPPRIEIVKVPMVPSFANQGALLGLDIEEADDTDSS